MTNFEYYKKEILERCNAGEDFTITSNGDIVSCDEYGCDNCRFRTSGNCNASLMRWLYAEYKKETPKLTKKERQFCELVETGWIVRDKGHNHDYIYYSRKYPQRESHDNSYWIAGSGHAGLKFLNNDLNFSFITWEDEEPWSIEELLKLEVEA